MVNLNYTAVYNIPELAIAYDNVKQISKHYPRFSS